MAFGLHQTSVVNSRWLAILGILILTCWFLPRSAHAGGSSIPWGNVPCDPPPAGVPDPGTGQQCAYITVPLDYRNPTGRQILLAVSIVHADPSKRRGVLFLNPGGPGGAGLDMPRLFYFLLSNTLGDAAAQSVLAQYDLVGFDPRFVGHSTGATCGQTAEQADQMFVPLQQNHSFDATSAFEKAVAADCAQNIGASTVPFATTANTARDMDTIRKRLGEDKINYFAWSYGTYLGAVYSTLFPDRTDRVILDSNVDPNWVWRQVFRAWGSGGALRWPDFANWAAANDATYHFGATADAVTATYFQLYDRADAQPFSDPDLLGDATLVNGPIFRELTFSFLEHDSSFASLAAFWQTTQSTASGERATAAASTVAQNPAMTRPTVLTGAAALMIQGAAAVPTALTPIPVDNKAASATAIVCDDARWSRSVNQYRAEFYSDSEMYPMFGPLGSNIYPCAFWANSPVEQPVSITSNGPRNVLMLQNLRDPNTPYDGALEMHSSLGQRSALVSVDEGGHAIFGFETNTCANDAAVAYLRDGVFPEGDVSCPANAASGISNAISSEKRHVIETLVRRLSILPQSH
jgi:pimeloyl-ACP methyl ester carboxylesterase